MPNRKVPNAHPATFNHASGMEQCLPEILVFRISSMKEKATQGRKGHEKADVYFGKVAVEALPAKILRTEKHTM